MVHAHGESRLVRRQRRPPPPSPDDPSQDVETVVVTMPNTFTGDVVWITQTPDSKPTQNPPKPSKTDAPKTLVPPATRAQSSSAEETSISESSRKPTSAGSKTSTSTSSQGIATASTFSPLSSIATSATTGLTGLVSATVSSSPSASASSEAAASGGMSGGAKAGLVLGVLVAIGALLGAILFVYHRKKKQVAQQKADNEKYAMQQQQQQQQHNNSPPPPSFVEPAPSIRTARTMSTAPRLSLRPVTQFDPALENRKSGGNMLDVAAAGAVPRSGNASPDRPGTSFSWERPGAAHAANAPANPFNDPPPHLPPPQNPFTNSAAIEPPQVSAPVSPVAAHHPTPDFGNPGPAIAAAEAADSASLMAALPAPPSIKSNSDSVPPSPAWTDDIPASPGPAPSGPLPVAVAGGPANGPAQAPNNVHRVQLDFKPSMSDELGLRAGQLVRMLHEYDDGWALCIRMDRSQQGVAPRTCLSKHPVKPRQNQQGPRMRGPPVNPPMQQGPPPPQQRSDSPPSGRNSPHPPALSPGNGRSSPHPPSLSPAGGRMSPAPRQMSPPQGRARSNSNAPYAGPPRSMSPGPYGGGPQMAPPPPMGRPRANSAGNPTVRRAAPAGPSPMNPNSAAPMPHRKPLPGQAL